MDQLLLKIKVSLNQILKKFDNILSYQEKRFLSQNEKSFSIPLFYIIPKVLKNPIVGRPIVGGTNWITKPASRFVAFHLQSYYKLFDTILLDKIDVVQFIESNPLDSDIDLSTLDIVGLYTNIPLDHFMECMRKLVLEDFPIPQGELIVDLLEFILYNNLLQFNGSIFIQIFGFAMGTSCAPIGANIYLALLEKDLKDLIASDPSLSWPKFLRDS